MPSLAPAVAAVRLLIVEDSATLGVLLESELRAIGGVEVVGVAPTVAEGIAAFQQQRPQIVVLDLNLTDGSGLGVLRAIRREDPACNVVIYSAYDLPLLRKQARDEGACEFVSKAAHHSVLVNRVAALVTGSLAEAGDQARG